MAANHARGRRILLRFKSALEKRPSRTECYGIYSYVEECQAGLFFPQAVAEWGSSTYMLIMSSKAPKIQTPEQLARLEKQRLAKVEGAQALALVEKQSVDIRKNMERLRALRLAKEAEDALNPPPVVPKKKKAVPKKIRAEVAKSEPEMVAGA